MTELNVLCCTCGVVIKPNPTNMCVNCIRTSVNITEGIAMNMTIHQCRGCKSWLRPGPGWTQAELESRELMAVCLRKITGLKKVKLVDAAWIWTEPHSRRLKLQLTVQKEVVNGAILQQAFVVVFVVRNQQCPTCAAVYTNNTWKAVVQVRQRVDHKRTFFYLEQLILKHNAHMKALNIQTFKDGMDFYYTERNQAVRFLDFLQAVVPCQVKHSKKLAGADNHSNLFNFHYSYICYIIPICKDDLVILPQKLAENLSQMGHLCLVKRVSSGVSLVDPLTAQSAEVAMDKYSRWKFSAILSSTQLTPYVVLGVELIVDRGRPTAPQRQKGKARMAEVVLAREQDLGCNDTQYTCVTHLGHVLHAGDTVLGYHMASANVDESLAKGVKGGLPEIVLVRKSYTRRRRLWRLRDLEVDHADEGQSKELAANERDREIMMQQADADKAMRDQMNLFKALRICNKPAPPASGAAAGAADTAEAQKKAEAGPVEAKGINEEDHDSDNDAENDEDDEEAVKLHELLDDMSFGKAEPSGPVDPDAGADGTAAGSGGLVAQPVVFAAGEAPAPSAEMLSTVSAVLEGESDDDL
ncbi:unnamed protein product [Chrysoparadoxa australica]